MNGLEPRAIITAYASQYITPSFATTNHNRQEKHCTLFKIGAEVRKEDIKGNAYLADLGVDSLMMIETISEISSL